MIQKLILTNFQTYKKAKIKFSSGLNAIIGSTDAGKSRIAKAIKWTALNKPRTIKVSPRSNPNLKTTSAMKIDDNIIKKVKGKGINKYILIDKNGKKNNFQSKVPGKIKKILNMSSLNFQNQHDAPFLLSISPGARGRYLNKTVDLEIIDRSQKNISSRIQKEHNKLSLHRQRVKSIRKQLKEFDWLTEASDQLRKVEIEERKINNLDNMIEGMVDILSDIKSNKTKIKQLKKITKYKNEVKEIILVEEEISEKEREIEGMRNLLLDLKDIKKNIKEYKARKNKLQKRFNKIMKGRCPLCHRKRIK